MVLKSFGCSFIYGNELQDCTSKQFSQSTWPALYAKHLGLDYQCHAQAGTGNLSILENLLGQLANPEPAIFVVNWTWIDRFDYNNRENNSWKSILPNDTDWSAQYYYRKFHSQYRDKFTTLNHIKLAIDSLQQRNSAFIMTYMDDSMMETAWHTSPAVNYLQTSIAPHLTKFNDMNLLDWSRSNNYPVSELWHPLDQAHQAAFEYIKNSQIFASFGPGN